jgi:hypothetical protein
MKAILDALKTRLAATSSLTAIVSTRIYLEQGPADASLPLLVYRPTAVATEELFAGVTLYRATFTFQVFFDNSGSQTIHTASDAIQTALATPLSPTGFDRAVFVRQSRGAPVFTDECWSILDEYRCTAFEV